MIVFDARLDVRILSIEDLSCVIAEDSRPFYSESFFSFSPPPLVFLSSFFIQPVSKLSPKTDTAFMIRSY